MAEVLSMVNPFEDAWCPTMYEPSALICRPLELKELLRLYQFPLVMDHMFQESGFTSLKDLPFLDCPPAEMVGAIALPSLK